jgi:hypothetical protein
VLCVCWGVLCGFVLARFVDVGWAALFGVQPVSCRAAAVVRGTTIRHQLRLLPVVEGVLMCLSQGVFDAT